MQRDKALRYAFFELLNGQLTSNGVNVPVADYKLGGKGPTVYVLIGDQTAEILPTMSTHMFTTQIELMLVHKQPSSVSKDILDDVQEQIDNLVIGDNPKYIGLTQQIGWQIAPPKEQYSNYVRWETNVQNDTALVKMITFKQLMVKQ